MPSHILTWKHEKNRDNDNSHDDMVDDNWIGWHQQRTKFGWNFRELHSRTFENLF